MPFLIILIIVVVVIVAAISERRKKKAYNNILKALQEDRMEDVNIKDVMLILNDLKPKDIHPGIKNDKTSIRLKGTISFIEEDE